MTSDRKKPTAGFWITVALVAALVGFVLYVASGIAIVELGRAGYINRSHEDSAFFYPLSWLLYQLIGSGG